MFFLKGDIFVRVLRVVYMLSKYGYNIKISINKREVSIQAMSSFRYFFFFYVLLIPISYPMTKA